MVGPLAVLFAVATSAGTRERARELQQRLGALPKAVDREAWIRSRLSARQMAVLQGLTGEDLRPWANIATLLVQRIRSLPRLPSLDAVGPEGWLREEAIQIRDWQSATQADALRLGWAAALAEAHAWHAALATQAQAEAPITAMSSQASVVWQGPSWIAVILDTLALVQAEGRILDHCVASSGDYWPRVQKGQIELYGLRTTQAPDTPVLTLEVETGSGRLLQARGKGNRVPTSREQMEAVEPFLGALRRKKASGKSGLDYKLAQFTILASRDDQGRWGPPDNEQGVHLYALQTQEQFNLLNDKEVRDALNISPGLTLTRAIKGIPGAAVVQMTGGMGGLALGPAGMDLGARTREKGLSIVAGPQWGVVDAWQQWDDARMQRPILEALATLGMITRRPDGVGGVDTVVHPFDHPIDAGRFVIEDWATPLPVARMANAVPCPTLPTTATVVARPMDESRPLTPFEVGLRDFAAVARQELQDAPGPEWRFPAAEEIWTRVKKAQKRKSLLSLDDVQVFLDAMMAASDACASMRIPRAWATVRLTVDPGSRKPGIELIWARDRLAVRVGRIRHTQALPGRWVSAVIAPTAARALSPQEQAEVKRRLARAPAWTPSRTIESVQRWVPEQKERQTLVPPVAILQQQPVEEALPEIARRVARMNDAPTIVGQRWVDAMARVQQEVWEEVFKAGLPAGASGPGPIIDTPMERNHPARVFRRRIFVHQTEWRVDPSVPLTLAWWSWIPHRETPNSIRLPGQDRWGGAPLAEVKTFLPAGDLASGRLVRHEVTLPPSHSVAQRFRKAFGTVIVPAYEEEATLPPLVVELPQATGGPLPVLPHLQTLFTHPGLGVLPWQDGWAILATPTGLTPRITGPAPASGMSWDGRAWRSGPPVVLRGDTLAANLKAAAATPLPSIAPPAPTPPPPKETDATLRAERELMRTRPRCWSFSLPQPGTPGGGAVGSFTRLWNQNAVNGVATEALFLRWLENEDHASFVENQGDLSLEDVDLEHAQIRRLTALANPAVPGEIRQFFAVQQPPRPDEPWTQTQDHGWSSLDPAADGTRLAIHERIIGEEASAETTAILSLSDDRHVRLQVALSGRRPVERWGFNQAWPDGPLQQRIRLIAVWSDPVWLPIPLDQQEQDWATIPARLLQGASVFFSREEARSAPRDEDLIEPNDLAWAMPTPVAQALIWGLLGPAWPAAEGRTMLFWFRAAHERRGDRPGSPAERAGARGGAPGDVRIEQIDDVFRVRTFDRATDEAAPLHPTLRAAHLALLRWAVTQQSLRQTEERAAFVARVNAMNRVNLTPSEVDRLLADLGKRADLNRLPDRIDFLRDDKTPLRLVFARDADRLPAPVRGAWTLLGSATLPMPPLDQVVPWGARLSARAPTTAPTPAPPPEARLGVDPARILEGVRGQEMVLRMQIDPARRGDLEGLWNGTLFDPMTLRDLLWYLGDEAEINAVFPDMGVERPLHALLDAVDIAGILALPFADGTVLLDGADVQIQAIRIDDDRPMEFVLRVGPEARHLPDVDPDEEVVAPAGEEGHRVLVVQDQLRPMTDDAGLAFVRPDGKDAYVALHLEGDRWNRPGGAQAWLLCGSRWTEMALDWRRTPREQILARRPSLFPDMDTAMAALRVGRPDWIVGPNDLPLMDMTTPWRDDWSQPMRVAWLLSVVWSQMEIGWDLDHPVVRARRFDARRAGQGPVQDLEIHESDDRTLRQAYLDALRDTIALWLDAPLSAPGRPDSVPPEVADALPHLFERGPNGESRGRGRDLFPHLRVDQVLPLAELLVAPAAAPGRCPWCDQAIDFDGGSGECGGEGQGICMGAAYAFDVVDDPEAAANEWRLQVGDERAPPPDDAMAAQIRAAFEPPEDIVCPGCHQVITLVPPDEGWGECGGRGNGLCPAAAYAIDMVEAPQDVAAEAWHRRLLAQWHRVVANQPPPDDALAARIREAFLRRTP